MTVERSIFGPAPAGELNGPEAPGYELNRVFYEQIRAASSGYELVDSSIVPPNRGSGFIVPAGHVFRIICEQGPQIGDVALWSAVDHKDRLNAVRTSVLEGWGVRPFSRVWSEVPFFHPLAACVQDTVAGVEEEVEWHHHFVSGHCTPEQWEMNTGRAGLNACHLNLLEGMARFGLGEDEMSDCINVHHKARIDAKTGQMYFSPSDSKAGDYVDFYAEVDLKIAVSVCPWGDGAALEPIPEEITLRPLKVEIFRTGIGPKASPTWTDWRPKWRGIWQAQSG